MEMATIISIILSCGGYVFGGYVRDILCGVVPKDIDCVVPHSTQFFQRLVKASKNGITILKDKYYDNYNSISRVIFFGYDGYIQIDIASNPLFSPDFDVNMLKITEDGISLLTLVVEPDTILDFSTVLQHITSRQAMPLSGVTSRRKKKIVEKGWMIID